ncbi:MAG: F0F1 ATP synthase subunit epsilon [Syntrophales bacterium]|jgi:F-type H+-transporting ATPase subunit epsilon|nr:F0F1 ATP synthase subunit epsilon [Syntrophales bacterium]
MADELLLEIVTPEKMAYSDKVEEVTIPGVEGAFGVLIGHAPLLSAVQCGELDHTKNNKKTYYAIGDGYAEVTGEKVTVLVESCERSDMIDTEKMRRETEELESELAKLSKDDKDYEKVSASLNKAKVRLKVAEKA